MVLGKWWFHCSSSTDEWGKCGDFMRKLFNSLSPSFSLVAHLWSPVLWTAARQASLSFTQFSSVQSLSHVRLFVTPWMTASQASLSITNSWSLPKFMSIELEIQSSHLILCHPLPSYLQFFPASGSFQMSQFSASHSQSIGVSASASIFPVNIQDWFPLGWTGWIAW